MQVDDWDCGKHSNIPRCCILWYIGPWQKIMMKVPKLWRMYYTTNETDKVEYIRCPVCIVRDHMVLLKDCKCDEGR
jgi:hypothetical protein